ncbi:MAG TPA: hypothetical protein VMV69_23755 [Pirellulales bacterium]|nr:hypothetical protein [Pirellulales bacterium]
MTRQRFWLTVILGGLTVVGLPTLGTWSRRHRLARCDLDGAAIEPIYAVRIVDAEGGSHEFCCILCADYWLARQTTAPREVRVTDEVGGLPIDAEAAFFVRSGIVTNQATGNRVHAFQERRDAEQHADSHGGLLLEGPERPFQ